MNVEYPVINNDKKYNAMKLSRFKIPDLKSTRIRYCKEEQEEKKKEKDRTGFS